MTSQKMPSGRGIVLRAASWQRTRIAVHAASEGLDHGQVRRVRRPVTAVDTNVEAVTVVR